MCMSEQEHVPAVFALSIDLICHAIGSIVKHWFACAEKKSLEPTCTDKINGINRISTLIQLYKLVAGQSTCD